MTPNLIIITTILTWPTVSLIIFIICYIYDQLKHDITSIVIGFWPIMLPILLGFVIVKKIQKIWVVIGGPKIRKLAPDRKQQEYEKACDHLRMAIRDAYNNNVPKEEIVKIVVNTRNYYATAGMSGEEVIQIVKDLMVKSVMES